MKMTLEDSKRIVSKNINHYPFPPRSECSEFKKYCSALFINEAQAFDKIWHKCLPYLIYKTLPIECRKVSGTIGNHLLLIEKWLANFRIKVNEQNAKCLSFALQPQSCPALKLNGINIPHTNDKTSLDILWGMTCAPNVEKLQFPIRNSNGNNRPHSGTFVTQTYIKALVS